MLYCSFFIFLVPAALIIVFAADYVNKPEFKLTGRFSVSKSVSVITLVHFLGTRAARNRLLCRASSVVDLVGDSGLR